MEAMAFRAVSVFLILSLGGFRLALTQTRSLQNVTQFLSQSTSVVIQCTSDFMSSASLVSWYMHNPQKTIIYTASTSTNNYPNKYVIGTGNNISLTIMNVQLTDAWTYCCTVDGLNDYCSNVVLIDSLVSTVYPSNGVSVGDNINLTCLLIYNAPSRDIVSPMPLSDDQEPNLSMMIGQTQITSDLTGEQVVGTTTVPHSISLSYNRTVAATDVGMNLTCGVSSASPQLSNQTTTPMNVFGPATMAKIKFPNGTKSPNDVYPINSVFTCVGNGFPIPTVDWFDVNKNSLNLQSSTGSTTWRATKEATNELYCVAWNNLNLNKTYNYTRCIVNSDGGNLTAPQPATANKVGLGVGLGIGLGVPILLGVIILIVILSRRKKASGPYPVKQPETKSKSPNTGKAPNGKNTDPVVVPRNNVNPNPNPSYTTPVMPEQTSNAAPRNVRDSPGYGDLGVRHIGGSGSNPHLNESFDSKADASFDSARNHSAGGNIVFKPGRTNASPSAPNTSV